MRGPYDVYITLGVFGIVIGLILLMVGRLLYLRFRK